MLETRGDFGQAAARVSYLVGKSIPKVEEADEGRRHELISAGRSLGEPRGKGHVKCSYLIGDNI